jgi:hypothetical protein
MLQSPSELAPHLRGADRQRHSKKRQFLEEVVRASGLSGAATATAMTHEENFAEVAMVRFEIAPSRAKDGRGTGSRFALLTDDQAYLLLATAP